MKSPAPSWAQPERLQRMIELIKSEEKDRCRRILRMLSRISRNAETDIGIRMIQTSCNQLLWRVICLS